MLIIGRPLPLHMTAKTAQPVCCHIQDVTKYPVTARVYARGRWEEEIGDSGTSHRKKRLMWLHPYYPPPRQQKRRTHWSRDGGPREIVAFTLT